MNWAQIQGKWQEYKGEIKQRWGKLTDQDIVAINGKREILAGKLLERSGAKDQIEKEIAEFESTCGCGSKTAAAGAGATATESCSTTKSAATGKPHKV